MCGITGVLPSHSLENHEDYQQHVMNMARQLRHRGPDHQGIWSDGSAVLGATRLAVQDLGPTGNQPMSDPEGQIHVVFNGEIYNYRALRTELEAAGFVFKGNCDTEVLVHGFLAWGKNILTRLRGMFAVAIWDRRTKRLLLARDRVGKKPLAYAVCGNDLVFASETKAILNWPGMPRMPNLEAIHHFLSFQYVPAPMSAFLGVSKLPPGHLIQISPGETPHPVPFTTIPTPDEIRHSSISEAEEELRPLLDEAVRLRMAADAPVGAFLSGGLDSSAVVAMMSRHAAAGKLKTFSVGFAEQSHDERPYAASVARHLGTDHHEIEMGSDLTALLQEACWNFDEPFADPSALPMLLVSKLAREHVTVVLTGDGGDEAFLGYERYAMVKDEGGLQWLPRPLRQAAAALSQHLPHDADGIKIQRLLGRFLAGLEPRHAHRYAKNMAYFEDHHKRAGYGESLKPYLSVSSFSRLAPYFDAVPSIVSGAAWADINTYLPDDLLVKMDMATMAHGLEARSPFLDQEFFAWALRLPEDVRFSPHKTKALLKSAMSDLLPRDILERPKMGFGLPIRQWLGEGLAPLARDLLLSRQFLDRGLFKREFVEKLFKEHDSGRFFHHPRIWALMILELWFQTWIDPAEPPGAPSANAL